MRRVAVVTIGQAPRPDIVPELLAMADAGPDDVACEEYGALDGVDTAELTGAGLTGVGRAGRELRLTTRLADGRDVVVAASVVEARLHPLLHRLDQDGFDLIVVVTTGLFRAPRLRTPCVHGQVVVDAWIAALLMGDCQLGLLYPLPHQHRGFGFGTLIQNAQAVAATGDAADLAHAAQHLAEAELILLHSVGYTEAMTRQVAELTRKPVVSARRIVAGAMRAQLGEAGPAARLRPVAALLPRLPDLADRLTSRERDVLAPMLDGHSNKEIGRRLGISHRTVEIHRGRIMSKLGATSPAQLLRRFVLAGDG